MGQNGSGAARNPLEDSVAAQPASTEYVGMKLDLFSFFRQRRGPGFAIGAAEAHFCHLLVCALSLVCGSLLFAISGERSLKRKALPGMPQLNNAIA
jgi:hypothetical protein